MVGLGKLLRLSDVAFLVFLVLGSVVLSPVAAARATLGFKAADREAARTAGGLARPREVATVGRGGAGVAESGGWENYYAWMLLNALPRGQGPTSGPSPQTNHVKT